MLPLREMMASMTTVPSTWAALAICGYSGWMGAMRLPARTPEETDKGFEEGVAAGGPTVMCGFAGAALLIPGGSDESVLPMLMTGK